MADNTSTEVTPLHRVKLIVFLLLWLALAAQVAWMLVTHFHAHVSFASMWYPLIFVISCLLLALTDGRVCWIATLLRVLTALAFLQAVGDRFRLFGGPGTPGVSWGDFAHFIAYTGVVNSFMPRAVIPTLAVLATIAEITCGLALLLGIRIRYAAIGSAILLFLFATAMTISGLSQFSYGVYLMSAGALSLATVDASFLSIDALLRRQRHSPAIFQ
jgi:putative oxidoreductase